MRATIRDIGMDTIICSDIPLKENNEKDDKELNKTEYFEFDKLVCLGPNQPNRATPDF